MSWKPVEVYRGGGRGSTVSDIANSSNKMNKLTQKIDHWISIIKEIGDLDERCFRSERGMRLVRDGLKERRNRGTREWYFIFLSKSLTKREAKKWNSTW